MAVQFQPKAGKPHLILQKRASGWYLWPQSGNKWGLSDIAPLVRSYCSRVAPKISYKTPGEAARALHYGSKE